jgi:hypothetical protein
VGPDRALLGVAVDDAGLERLAALIEPLGGTETIVFRLVREEADLPRALERLKALAVRGAAFTSAEPALDGARLAATWDVQLVLVSDEALFEPGPADVAVATGPAAEWAQGDGVFVPFGGSDDDWAALELGAWLASAAALPLRAVGRRAIPGRRDASRMLANASIAVQRVVGIVAEPMLADALLDAVAGATIVVAGARTPLTGVRGPLLRVLAGPRPGVLAPRESRTRFSWSLAS